MPIIDDPRDTQSAIVGAVNAGAFTQAAPLEEESPPVLDTLAAASRTAFLPGAIYERFANRDPNGPRGPAAFDPLSNIAGYEDFADKFVGADSPTEVEGIKARIGSERADRQTLQRAGIGGPAAEIALNFLDPSFWVSAAVPELAIARIARVNKIATAAVRGAAGAAAYEAGMHAVTETCTLGESGISIAGGAILSGVLGSLGRRMNPAELARARASVNEAIAVNPDPGSQSFGAAAVQRATTLEAESFAAGGDRFSKVVGKIPLTETDLQKVFRSESVQARTALQDLAEVSATLNKNREGIATPAAVESLVVRHEGAVADFITDMRGLFKAYRARDLAPGEARLSRHEFEEAVASASRRSDKSPIPEVAKSSQVLRERVFQPLKIAAQKLGLLPADSEIDLFAESYFRRMWDRHAIRARRGDWDALLEEHFRAKGMMHAEARSTADDITRRILGAEVGDANFNLRSRVKDAGPLHERVLDIRDELAEPFLVNDPAKVARAYVRELAPQIEITKRFGDKNMTDAFQRIRDEYAILRTKAGIDGNSKRVNALTDNERDTIEALTRVRDRIYGRAGSLGPDSSSLARSAAKVARDWRNLVAAAKLGGTALTGGMQDLSRVVATNGFLPTMTKLAQLATRPAFRQLSRNNARRLGVALEVAMAKRVAVASDGAMTEGWTEKLANLTYKASGLNHITDLWRTLSATLIEDKILGAAAEVAGGGELAKGLRTDLATLGLDVDALRRIHAQVLEHGLDADGMRTSGSMFWKDSALAERYDAAIIKEARTAVMQPGAANRTWWADNELGKTLGQIKSFSIAAPLQLTVTPIQLLGQGRAVAAARFVGAMMVGGALVHVARQTAANMAIQTDPRALAGEAFAESGLAGILPDLLSPVARRFGIFGESARYSDRNVTSTFGGPAVGTLVDAYDLIYNRTNKGLSANDLHALRRLLPLQNLWWARRGINALEGETAEALNLEGATAQSFGDRMIETTPMRATGDRGGTGTGRLVQ